MTSEEAWKILKPLAEAKLLEISYVLFEEKSCHGRYASPTTRNILDAIHKLDEILTGAP